MTTRSGLRLALITACLLLAVALLWSQRDPAPDHAPLAPRSEADYLRAVHWFGSGWAVNFWNTDLEARARADFSAIKADGFNSIVLLVPWAGFTIEPSDGALIESRRERLLALIRLADEMDLKVVLRVSYAWDALARDSAARLTSLWIDPAAYDGWLQHLEALWELVGAEPNLQFGFFSWEDLWAVMSFADADLAQRLQASGDTGFRTWLQNRHSLTEVGERYGRAFGDWNEVFIPGRREPAFKLFLQFVDEQWIQRFFLPAQQRFPKLSMEIRIDSDPVWNGDELVEWHSHELAWDLPGAEWTTIYWSPAMGGKNRGEALSPETAAERLTWMLERIRDGTGARQIFIGQFLAEDYTPGFESNGRIPRDQVGQFLQQAGSPLANLAGGYGLWTWTDYRHDAIANPEFQAGLAGWDARDGAVLEDGALRLPVGASVVHPVVIHEYHTPGGPKTATLCVQGEAIGSAPAELWIRDLHGGTDIGRLDLPPDTAARCLDLTVADLMELEFRAEAELRIERISSTGFVQPTGMRDVGGQPKPIAADYRALNAALQKAPQLERPLYADGWMGRSLSMRMELPQGGARQLRLKTHLPSDWPVQPQLIVSVNGQRIGNLPCADNADVHLPLPQRLEGTSAALRIDASTVHRPGGDERDLGCLLGELEWVDGR